MGNDVSIVNIDNMWKFIHCFFSNLENVHRMECIVSENFFYDNDFGTYQSYVW